MTRLELLMLLLLVQCGARTDLGGAGAVDASAGDSCASTAPTTCAQPECAGGTCVAKVSDAAAYGVLLHEDHIFWSSAHAVMRADKCGANATVVAGCVDGTRVRAQDAEHVYFTTTLGPPLHETLSRVSKNGGEPVELASFDVDVESLAIEGGELFLGLQPAGSSPEGRLVKMPASGGAQTTLFTGRLDHGLAVDNHEIFFGSAPNIMRIHDDGTGLTTLADMTLLGFSASTEAIALDSNFVYATSGCGDVQRAARDGSTAKAELLGMVSLGNGALSCYGIVEEAIALDDAFVYLGYGGNAATPASILRVPKVGGTLETVVTSAAAALAVDPSGIFWNDGKSLSLLTSQ